MMLITLLREELETERKLIIYWNDTVIARGKAKELYNHMNGGLYCQSVTKYEKLIIVEIMWRKENNENCRKHIKRITK